MLTTVVAILCSLSAPNACREEIVTDEAGLTECAIHSQLGVSKWMSEHPVYSHGWRVAAIRCAPGGYKKAVKA